jgi:trigger factor
VEIQTKQITKTKEGAEITVPTREIKPHFDKVYEDFRAKAEIKGFRKGKAPRSLIQKMYGEAIESEAINEAINDLYRKAMLEKKLQPVGDPVLKNVDYKPDGDFTFAVEYEVLPQIELQDYKGIEVEKPIQKMSEEMIERELRGVRLNYATRSEVSTVTDEYHTLTVDIQELDEQGIAIIGKRTPNQTINLFDERYEKDLIDPLLNSEKDGEYVIKYSHNHGDHKHDVHIKVTVKKIEKVTLPELDDQFVKDTFKDKFESAAALREDIRKQIQAMFDQEGSRVVRDRIADEIVKRHDFPIPEALLTKVFDQMIEDVKSKMPDQKLPADFDRHAFEAEYYTHAEWQAKWSILRDKLFEAEDVKVEDNDIDERAARDAAQYGLGKDKVLQFYSSNQQVFDSIRHNKLMDVLESYAAITEKEVKPDDEKEQQQTKIIT